MDLLGTLALLFIFCACGFAQGDVTRLYYRTPVESELTNGTPKRFTLQLAADQTAVIEADQAEMDVSLTSFDSAGNKLLVWGLPLGRVGSETILVIANVSGEYHVEVSPGNRHATAGKFVINITDLRDTTENDRIRNDAARAIGELMVEAEELKSDETAASYRKAVENWKKVVELSRVKEDRAAEARALHALGNLYVDFGEIQLALDVNLQAIKMWRELHNKRFELVASGRIANIWYQTGEYEKSLAQNQELLSLTREIASRTNETVLHGNIGSNYLALGQPETAIVHFEEALSMFSGMNLPLFEAPIMKNLGSAYIDLGNYPKGIEFLENALKIQQRIGYRIDSPQYYIQLAIAYQNTGESGKAYDLFLEANKIANESGTLRYAVQSLYYLAEIEYRDRNFTKAVEHIETGLKMIERIRGEIRNKDLRTGYFSTVQNFYELYAELLIERSKGIKNSKDVALAFEMSERSRSRGLIDLLHTARVDLNQGIDPKLLRTRKDLSDELTNKYRILDNLQSGKSDPKEITRINGEIVNLELEAERLNVQIGQENPRYSELTNAKPLGVRQIQHLLDDRTVLLEYKLGKRRSFAWLVTRDSIEVFTLPSREEIESKARSFYDLIVANNNDRSERTNEAARQLSGIILPPVTSDLKNKRIAIVADGVLQYIPFSALRSARPNDRYLIESNEIVVLPSASVLSQLRSKPNNAKPGNKKIAIFADPVFDLDDPRISQNAGKRANEKDAAIAGLLRDFRFGETLPRLLASRAEVRHISALVDKSSVNVEMDFDANIENVEKAGRDDYQILHFATHGLLNSSRPELSGLVFSLYNKDGQKRDGFLTLNHIYNLDISSDLVVLSACQTALGKEVRGEGLIGLSRGFLYAGSTKIVASLWKVDDSATAEFMNLFYKNHLQKNLPASAALRAAKLEMKKSSRYRSPYYWSAFTILGDWR